MEQLHPGAKWSFRIAGYLSVIVLAFVISGFLAGFLAFLGLWFFVLLIVLIIVFLVLVEIFVQLAYKFWKYEFTKEGLKIERGIIWKTYKSIPYGRVQNVDIRRGIIARILGFSTLDVQTAGYAGFRGKGRPMAEGHIPAVGVEKAEELREMIIKKIGKRSSGF